MGFSFLQPKKSLCLLALFYRLPRYVNTTEHCHLMEKTGRNNMQNNVCLSKQLSLENEA
jgi:hypothetical protein